ncbi:MAG: hypothetical protein JWM82_2131, partial [Myxococcales bacterium]|nr:hypothetical protein [Myxococcales bacterium]
MRDIGRFVGQSIGAQPLGFWGILAAVGLAGCAPAIPEGGAAPSRMPAVRDAGAGNVPGAGPPRGATGTPVPVGAPTSARADAAS